MTKIKIHRIYFQKQKEIFVAMLHINKMGDLGLLNHDHLYFDFNICNMMVVKWLNEI